MGSSLYNVELRIYVLGNSKRRMKIFALVLTIALLAVQVMPAPILQKFLPQLTRSGLKEHGKNKVLAGGALWGVGALTNNQGLQKAGATVFKAGPEPKLLHTSCRKEDRLN